MYSHMGPSGDRRYYREKEMGVTRPVLVGFRDYSDFLWTLCVGVRKAFTVIGWSITVQYGSVRWKLFFGGENWPIELLGFLG
jgi:hypothetical protein